MGRAGYDGSSGFDSWVSRGVGSDNMVSGIPVNGTLTIPVAGYITDIGVYASTYGGINAAAELFAFLGSSLILDQAFSLTPGSQSVGGQHWNTYTPSSPYFLPINSGVSIGIWRDLNANIVWSAKTLSGYQYDYGVVATSPGNGGNYGAHTVAGGQALGAYFDYNPAAPIINSDSQNNATPGTTIALYGNAFTGTTSVTLGGVGCSFSVVSDTQLNVTIPNGQYYQSTFSATNAYGTGTSSFTFTTDYAPNISSFSPGNGPVGTAVTISGYLLSTTASVKFNGVSASFTVQSDNQITATVPAGAQTGGITVTNAYGSTTTASFTVNYPPTISGVSPSPAPPGTSVTITGTFFVGATAVKFNGVNATSFTVNSQTSITATVPSNAGGGSPVTVTTPYGTATFSGFTATQAYAFDGTAWQILLAEDGYSGTTWQQFLGIYVYDGTTWQQIG